MKANFTQGPWKATAIGTVVTSSGSSVLNYVVPNRADQTLIAAAPDLLEALEDAIGFIEDTTMSDDELELKHKIIAALAKAKGE